MGKIKLLEQFIIDRIAAGEVVQRPMNVVKELVENSIDADASALTIEIKDGGVSYIRVTDNGSGMSDEDAMMAFQRHATSKISVQDDLDHIHTLGFRGEALSAIAAVSHMEITTKSAEAEAGVQITVDGGVLTNRIYQGVPDGTTIIVKDLFYNTPARRKFLKSHGAETAAVSDIVSRFILSYPNIAFQFISNEKTVMQSFGDGKLLSAASAVYGADIDKKTLNVNYQADGITITGFIGVPQYAFKNRKMQSLFINGRYILSDKVRKIIALAYNKWLVPGLFPFYVLNIMLPAEDVDVNIHPNKLEIKFKDETGVANVITEAISFTLSTINALPKVQLRSEEKKQEESEQQVFHIVNSNEVNDKNNMSTKMPDFDSGEPPATFRQTFGLDEMIGERQSTETEVAMSMAFEENTPSTPDNELHKHVIKPDIRLIGSFLNAYLLVEYGQSLLIIDQHAAHERILFDQLMKNYDNKKPNKQILLMPETIQLSLEEKTLLSESRDSLLTLGFEFKCNQTLSATFTAIPSALTDLSLDSMLDDVFDTAKENNSMTADIEAMIMRSCKRAVKAGDPLPFEEAKHLIDEFIQSGHMPTCPHGRPVITILSEDALKKYFKRIV